jgi:OOP family OmpA-OmpF porin
VQAIKARSIWCVVTGVDLDLVANDLAERLPTDVAFHLARLKSNLPERGTTRTNAATVLMKFSRTVSGCSNVVFERRRCRGLCGADAEHPGARSNRVLIIVTRLDATSIRTINALAARCFALRRGGPNARSWPYRFLWR